MGILDERAKALESESERLKALLTVEYRLVADTRRRSAAGLAEEVAHRLRSLAMVHARLGIEVNGPDPADEVIFKLAANPGEPLVELAKVASGGELARTMLALRLVLTSGPPTMVFDEVDSGVGGEAAMAVGRALAEVGDHRQVIVVTHLPQVAAYADRHFVVSKSVAGDRTIAAVRQVSAEERVIELARMLSGQPGSRTAQVHAQELLDQCQRRSSA